MAATHHLRRGWETRAGMAPHAPARQVTGRQVPHAIVLRPAASRITAFERHRDTKQTPNKSESWLAPKHAGTIFTTRTPNVPHAQNPRNRARTRLRTEPRYFPGPDTRGSAGRNHRHG